MKMGHIICRQNIPNNSWETYNEPSKHNSEQKELLMSFLSASWSRKKNKKLAKGLRNKSYLLLPWMSSFMMDFPLWNHSMCASDDPDIVQLNIPAAFEFTIWCCGLMWAERYEWTFKTISSFSSPYWFDALQIYIITENEDKEKKIRSCMNIRRGWEIESTQVINYPSASISVISISYEQESLRWDYSLWRWYGIIWAWVW